ncbi:hypothetical protein OAH18_00545 [bacterium]|nr:hypothetical protein [bacterium]
MMERTAGDDLVDAVTMLTALEYDPIEIAKRLRVRPVVVRAIQSDAELPRLYLDWEHHEGVSNHE